MFEGVFNLGLGGLFLFGTSLIITALDKDKHAGEGTSQNLAIFTVISLVLVFVGKIFS
jgi:hypothetical protein